MQDSSLMRGNTVRKPAAPILLLITASFLSGCIPAVVGGIAGSEAARSETTSPEKIKEYVRTHDVKPRIARAMEREEVVKGMNVRQVELVEGKPKKTVQLEEQTARVYAIVDSSGTVWEQKTVYFEDGEVARVEEDR